MFVMPGAFGRDESPAAFALTRSFLFLSLLLLLLQLLRTAASTTKLQKST